jgi:hypothetical protein
MFRLLADVAPTLATRSEAGSRGVSPGKLYVLKECSFGSLRVMFYVLVPSCVSLDGLWVRYRLCDDIHGQGASRV